MLSSIAEIIRDLLNFIIVIAALLITLVVVISKMPAGGEFRGYLVHEFATACQVARPPGRACCPASSVHRLEIAVALS
jgi:hypothetical protein